MGDEEKGEGCKATFWVIVVVLLVVGFSWLVVDAEENHKRLDKITEFECEARGMEFYGKEYVDDLKENVGYCIDADGLFQFVKIE